MKVIPFNLFCSSNFKPVFNQGVFFFLLQCEDGDLYKVTIEHEEEEVKSLRIKYFATVLVASSLYSHIWFPFCRKRVWQPVSAFSPLLFYC